MADEMIKFTRYPEEDWKVRLRQHVRADQEEAPATTFWGDEPEKFNKEAE